MNPMQIKIEEANKQGKVGLIPFLPAGFPNREQFWKELAELDAAGASVIEIGMPFSDPVADGPVVEKASLKCLEDGINLEWILTELKKRKGQFKAALLLMGYLNPVYQYGLDTFAADCEAAGVSGLIIADMPHEESQFVKDALTPHGISLVPLVGLNTTRERMKLYAQGAQGFCYFVSVLGTTGQRESLPARIKEKLAEAKEVFDIPIALGFGIKHPDQLKEFEGLMDAAVFGSALITHIQSGKSSDSFMEPWK
ncbi:MULTISPECIES: tryptophan synthase subunit alpha [unclassified Pseudodesulfovibrio]|uniref:tryptophan synthase subunit alpha n=1 Tax=unclassified Pseudodesulfovibrio TaxID=2661612 RepID=UPI000FEBDD91|nr:MULTISPECIES: tryptophan synthase subunit alpha [unclassified Pseudodesulfovibrio]MCJ2164596.1 tryptophan synthase subunit alpha [Pseudodesulfovibrio sp. S3-i]RWU04209.1 tryptophan synthase subunit alpha [Pseudodesulfovibrio sp. S3]